MNTDQKEIKKLLHIDLFKVYEGRLIGTSRFLDFSLTPNEINWAKVNKLYNFSQRKDYYFQGGTGPSIFSFTTYVDKGLIHITQFIESREKAQFIQEDLNLFLEFIRVLS